VNHHISAVLVQLAVDNRRAAARRRARAVEPGQADATRATGAACSAETVLALEERSRSDHAPVVQPLLRNQPQAVGVRDSMHGLAVR